MTLAITRADVDWFLSQVPGTTPEEIERLKKEGIIEVKDDD